MEYVLDGYCGLYCGACPLMLASKAGTAEDPCFGCKSQRLPASQHCATCGIKQCARDHGFDYCDECAELSGCDRMKHFMADPDWPYHQSVLANLARMRAVGLESWLAEQAQRWACPQCGQAQSWWDETCKQCGQAVANYRADL